MKYYELLELHVTIRLCCNLHILLTNNFLKKYYTLRNSWCQHRKKN